MEDEISRTEWDKLVEKVDCLENTLSEWQGGIRTLKWMFGTTIGVGLMVLGTMITLGTSVVTELNAHTTQLAVTQERYDAFMSKGARFTPDDYDMRIRADKAEIYNNVRDMLNEWERNHHNLSE